MAISVSIHALLAECDTLFCPGATVTESFNPRTPCGVRRQYVLAAWGGGKFQSTHSLRSATLTLLTGGKGPTVSIHALLAECDPCAPRQLRLHAGFNPRTPCGVRLEICNHCKLIFRFQSTHSLRSATGFGDSTGRSGAVSIHALLAECDFRNICPDKLIDVSIHALLAECDSFPRFTSTSPECFNPRTPCGVRQVGSQAGRNVRKCFNPRTPCGVRL